MSRTPQNCRIADKFYYRDDPERYEGNMCVGIRTEGDEPIETCKKCKWCIWRKDNE